MLVWTPVALFEIQSLEVPECNNSVPAVLNSKVVSLYLKSEECSSATPNIFLAWNTEAQSLVPEAYKV